MCQFIRNLIFSKFDFTVTITIGKSYKGIENIRKSYEDAQRTLRYKFAMGNNNVILANEIELEAINKTGQINYKKHFRNALNALKQEEIINILNNFKSDMGASVEIEFYCKELLNTLAEYLIDINYNNSSHKKELENTFLEFEKLFNGADEAIDWINKFIEKVLRH